MSVHTPSDLAVTLAPVAESAERSFLAAGRSLESAVSILDRLNSRFSAQTAELTDGRLDAAGDGLAAAGAQVTQLADAHAADTSRLQSLNQVVGSTTRHLAALEPITHEIATLAMSARVVAGGMGAAGDDFLAFTASIQNAVQSAQSSLHQVRQDIQRVDQDLSAARLHADAFLRRHGATIHAIPQRLDANRNTLAERRALAGHAAEAAQQRADAIAREVGEQIVALQLGDITRQRLEHVQAGAQLCAGLPQGHASVVRVLAAQLQDTADTLVQEGQQIERRLTQLAADAAAIDQLGLDVRADTADRHDSFATTLKADLRQTVALFAELRAADDTAGQRIRSVLDAAGTLTQRLAAIQSVEQDIHIIGLNATLKCGRLGTAGRALAAVAQELRACGQRFASGAAGVVSELDRLRAEAAALLRPERQQQHAALAQAADGMLAAVEQLHRLEDQLQQGVTQLQADAEQVGRLVSAALEQFSVRHSVAQLMRESADQLASWSDPRAAITQGEAVALNQIAASYTMAREREVHATLAPLPETASPAAADPSDPGDDFLF